jgi:hypothetical protein
VATASCLTVKKCIDLESQAPLVNDEFCGIIYNSLGIHLFPKNEVYGFRSVLQRQLSRFLAGVKAVARSRDLLSYARPASVIYLNTMPSECCYCGQAKIFYEGEPIRQVRSRFTRPTPLYSKTRSIPQLTNISTPEQGLCHCSECKKYTSSAYSINIIVSNQDFRTEGPSNPSPRALIVGTPSRRISVLSVEVLCIALVSN